MNKFCSIINNGYSSNFKFVKIVFKRKYIYLLEKLLKYNCILNYSVENGFIKIGLKYYQNKPLFKINLNATNSNKKYYRIYEINKIKKYNNFDLNIFSTTGGILLIDEVLFKNVSGNFIIKITFFNNK